MTLAVATVAEETAVIFTKGLCLLTIPAFTALSAGLPEIGMPTLFGVPVKVWVLASQAIVAGAGGLLAFISTSFGNYLVTRSGGGDPGQPTPPKPTTGQ